VIANLALVSLVPNYREAMDLHNKLIRNVAQWMPRSGKHIYFSTMSVYGDARVHQKIVCRDLYGREKSRCEKVAQASGKQFERDTYIFRLGHVCGELQGITRQIREEIAVHPMSVPDLDRASNTVHVATIVDAILKVAAGSVTPGTYDLMNVPQWSWKEVFEYEGRAIGVSPKFEGYAEKVGIDPRDFVSCQARRWLTTLGGKPLARRAGSRVLGLLPPQWLSRLKAMYSTRAAAAEIAKLIPTQEPMDAVLRRPVGRKFIDALTPTIDLLRQPEFHLSARDRTAAWPEDMSIVEDGVVR
jgi:dTDP-4-dehydrorhamnose reductase